MKRLGARLCGALLLCACVLLLAGGCARSEGYLNPDITLPPTPEPEPTFTPEPESTPTPVPESTETPVPVDYWRYYLALEDVFVYEQDGETYVDAVIVSDYEGTLVGVLELRWADKNGPVAAARLVDGAGEELLYLRPGQNRVYGVAQTDMPVTMLDFTLAGVGAELAVAEEMS